MFNLLLPSNQNNYHQTVQFGDSQAVYKRCDQHLTLMGVYIQYTCTYQDPFLLSRNLVLDQATYVYT